MPIRLLAAITTLCVVLLIGVEGVFAQPPAGGEQPSKPATGEAGQGGLTGDQQQVAERFRELEKLLLRMAELTAPTDPRRAALLRQAVAESKGRDIDQQFNTLLELLKKDQLALVVKNQVELHGDLKKLLELLLSEDRTKRIETEKERIREYLKRVNKIIKEQRGIQAQTLRNDDLRKLADRQAELADKTGELSGDLRDDAGKPAKDRDDKKPKAKDAQPKAKDDDGKDDSPKEEKKKEENKNDRQSPDQDEKSPNKPGQDAQGQPRQGESRPGEEPSGQPRSEEQPPQGSPAQQRLERAQQRMREAEKKLEESQRSDANDKQAEALQELEQAKADLEEILRQLREEEMSRTLAMLEARFRKMLDAQVEVYEGTKRLDKVPLADRDRDDEIEAGRLGRKEMEIATEADKALNLLREEGSAVAFPEAVSEMRDDMQQVVERLAESKVGEVTQGVEKDIITALEEMIASLKKAQKEMENKAAKGELAAGEMGEPPLVDTISELKMIRALQMRVNQRTQRYAEMTKTEQVDKPDLLTALRQLAEREQRIHKVTRDIVVGRNR